MASEVEGSYATGVAPHDRTSSMPAVTCPFCQYPTTLPDPWHHPGYTCPHCRATVAMALPPPAPAYSPPVAADPFDIDDGGPSRPARVEVRNRTRVSDSVGQGFGDQFGRVFGGCVAQLLIGGFILLVLGATIVALSWRANERAREAEQEPVIPAARKPAR